MNAFDRARQAAIAVGREARSAYLGGLVISTANRACRTAERLTAVTASGVPFAVTHAPGHMFITDVPDSTYHV